MYNLPALAERKSMPYFQTISKFHNDVNSSIYASRFVDDIQNNVMPIGGSARDREEFKVVLAGHQNESIAVQVNEMFRTPRSASRDDLAVVISTFIAQVARYLAVDGEKSFEVFRVDESEGDGSTNTSGDGTNDDRNLRVSPIPGRIIRLGNQWAQEIPHQERHNKLPSRLLIPPDHIWYVKLPAELGSPSEQKRLVSTLISHSAMLPAFAHSDVKDSPSGWNFDFKVYRQRTGIHMGLELARWAWPLAMMHEGILEFYDVYRHLQFARSVAILRIHIINSMNNLLHRLGFMCRIHVSGLPIPTEIDQLLHQLEAGELSFDAAVAAIRF